MPETAFAQPARRRLAESEKKKAASPRLIYRWRIHAAVALMWDSELNTAKPRPACPTGSMIVARARLPMIA